MNSTLHRIARERAEELPGSTLDHPFGEEWDVYKVRGKMFMLLTELGGDPMVNLKAAPADVQTLQEQFECVGPGYHMNKKHWISVRPSPELDPQLVADLVTESYLLVVEKLPRSQRPVDPQVFGQTPTC